jgi:predicted acylesterase/phospholipase RssA
MTAKIKFGFQGGGARLALLLPVVQAIRECEGDGHGDRKIERIIEVTGVAGTSAGAIAAALVAAKADMTALARHLRTVAQDHPEKIRAAFPVIGEGLVAKAKMVWKILGSQPIGSEENFAEFLKLCLQTAGINPSTAIGNIAPPCTIICTDTSAKGNVIVATTTPLLQVLLDSTALPFIFRSHGSKVDGGLVDNLPIDHLTPGPDNDRILAVAFDEDAYALPADGAFSFAASLLDSAISSKTRSTKRILGNNYVLSLSPDAGDDIVVDSFNVEGFIKFMASENAYNTRVDQAKNWIIRQADEVEKRDMQITLTPKVLSKPDEAVKQLRSTFDNIGKISQSYHKHDNILVIHSALEVVAFSLRDPTRNDLIRYIDRIRVTSGSINIYVSKFFSSNTSQDTVSTLFHVFDNQMRHIDFALLEVPEHGKLAKSCVIIFGRPLIAGEPDDVFTIVQEQLAPAVMEPLARYGADYLAAEVIQSPTADRVEIALAVPKEFGLLSIDDGTEERLKTLPIHNESDLNVPIKNGERIVRWINGAPSDFDTYAWGASNLVRPQQVRMLVRKLGTNPLTKN